MNVTKKTTKTSTVTTVSEKTNRIFVIDCSGSMSSNLYEIRSQMKNKIPQLTDIGDTVSIIWFSGRGQCGILQEGLEINTVTDFKNMNAAIDKFLRPVCLTGFKEPLDLVATLSKKLKAKYANSVAHMFFMTDGCDNSWTEKEIINSTESLAETVDAATFVEYGWYCNRSLMTKMAESIGASLMFSKSFDDYDGVFTSALKKKVKQSTKREVDLGNINLTYAFAKDGNDILTFTAVNGKITVPDHLNEIYYFAPTSDSSMDDDGKYAAVYTLAQRMMGNEVLDILGDLGDVFLIDTFNNCFSKQDYSDFQEYVLECVNDASKRYIRGKKANYVPAADAPTIIDALDILASTELNKFHPYDPQFKYEKISATRANAAETLTDSDKETLLEQMKSATSLEDAKAVADAIAALGESKVALKFIPNEVNGGYSINSLTFSEDRPNISMLIRINGTVELPDSQFPSLPKKFPTFIFRNYAMVKDGIKHSSMTNLPIELSIESFDELKTIGVIDAFESHVPGKIYYLNVNLPVVNRKMATSVSANEFFNNYVKLQKLKSSQKVLNTFKKQSFEKISEGFALIYGKDASEWLKEIGITDFNGYSPSTVKTESTDVYTAKEFSVSIAKCSSIPTVNDKLLEKVRKTPGKMTLSESLCAPAITSYDTLLESPVYKSASDQKALLKTWLETEAKGTTATVRTLIRELAKTKFAIMVGHVWFKEFGSLDENSMTITVDGQTFDCKAELKDIEIKI